MSTKLPLVIINNITPIIKQEQYSHSKAFQLILSGPDVNATHRQYFLNLPPWPTQPSVWSPCSMFSHTGSLWDLPTAQGWGGATRDYKWRNWGPGRAECFPGIHRIKKSEKPTLEALGLPRKSKGLGHTIWCLPAGAGGVLPPKARKQWGQRWTQSCAPQTWARAQDWERGTPGNWRTSEHSKPAPKTHSNCTPGLAAILPPQEHRDLASTWSTAPYKVAADYRTDLVSFK